MNTHLSCMLLFSLIILLPMQAWCYPEMRFLEKNGCISCHQAPYGGGLLTKQGRKSAGSELASWANPDEELPTFGYIKSIESLEWLTFGGDFRYLKLQQELPPDKISKDLVTQKDFELGIQWGRVQIVGAYSGPEYPSGTRRNWILYDFGSDWRIRLGKFQPSFGINTPYHFLATRDPLSFGIQSEYPGIEISRISQDNEFYLSAFKNDSNFENSQSVTWNTNESDSLQLGLSFQKKANQLIQQDLIGAHFITGEFNHFVILGEADLSQYKDLLSGKSFQGAFEFLQLKYWLERGLAIMIYQDAALKKINSSSQQKYSLGVGIDWNPRPHWQLEGILQETQDLSFGPETQNAAILQLHFYL